MSRISRATGCAWLPGSCFSRVVAVIAMAGFAAGAVRTVYAQGGAIGQMPSLDQHIFVPTTFIPDAFINTQLTLSVGSSNSIKTDVPLFTDSGQQIGTVHGDLLFLTGGVDFHYAARDWVGFFLHFSALARSGNNTASIFASGLSAGSASGLGWEFRLHRTERSQLSGSVSVDRTFITLINVSAFVDDPALGLARSYTPLLTTIDARYAYAFNDLVGLSAWVAGGVGENPAKGYDNVGFYKVGAVASIDLSRRHRAPIGFDLGARASSYPMTFDNVNGNTWAGLFSIAYVGRPDFSLTLDTSYERVPLGYHDVDIGYLGFTIGLKYFF